MIPKVLSPATISRQQALQWWHQRQLDRQHQSAERIRDGLLQDLFVIRRSLEVTQDQSQSYSGSHLAQVMEQLDSLHGDLEVISNHLSPPFAHDNFNLAVQYLLQQWQEHHPQVVLESSLEMECHGPISNDYLALMTLTEWLDLIPPLLSDTARVDINLHTQNAVPPQGQGPPPEDRAVLTLGIYEPDLEQRKAIARQTSLVYLCEAFRFLSGGQVTDNRLQETAWLQWQLCWSLSG